MKKLSVFSTLALAMILSGAKFSEIKCDPKPPPVCYPDDCKHCYCLGPENYGVNTAVRPKTCNGDLVIAVSGLYWVSNQDGMTYAIESQVNSDSNINRVDIIDSKYKRPHFDWDFGYKVGLGYNTTCDGWDIGILWTHFQGKAFSHDEAERDHNSTLLPLWSNFAPRDSFRIVLPIYATDIKTYWKLDLNLIDIELGRDFWNSKKLSIRPYVGIRIGFIQQNFNIQHKGGVWSPTPSTNETLNNEVDLDNDFKGVGIRGGFNTLWNFGCGWALYGNAAYSLLYGRFDIDHDEQNKLAVSPFTKQKIFESEDGFRVSRPITDLGLGVQWSGLFCKCQYAITASLGWEQHFFLDQNQMWRITRTIATNDTANEQIAPNNFHERRGDLSTSGWTLSFKFEF